MKTPHLLSFLGAIAAVGLMAGCATTRVEDPSALRVHVNVPPSWNMLIEDRVSMAFADVVRDVFHRQGFDRPVEEARFASLDELDRIPYLLTINLNEWRMTRIGNIECRFTASLQTPRGTRNLGVYTNTTMRWLGGIGRFGLARSFEEAADGAITDMCRDIAKSELLPDLRARQAADTT